jgi:exonuclease SbcC
LILKKVIIENIRSHEYLEFEPASIGVTAISGENGAGKSTIVDAFSWSLFGTRLHGLRNKNYIREGVDAKEKTVQVISYIRVGNTDFMIKRKITSNEGACECKVFSYNEEIGDWEFESGPAVTHAESFIRSILNIDEKGFLSSVFIQQKQVDQIVSASPTERGQVIEKLIGVSAITESTKLAREESRALQRAADIIQPGSLDDEKAKVDEFKIKVTTAKDNLKDVDEALKTLEQELVVLRATEQAETELQNHLDSLNTSLDNVKKDDSYLKENLKNYTKILKDNSEISIDYKLKEIIEEELSESLEKEKAIQNELNNINIQITRYTSLFEETLNYDEIKASYDEITDNYNDLMNKKSVLDEALMGLKVKVKSVKQHLELLKSGAAECPVCGHPILNPEEEFKKHTEEQNENKKEFKQIKEELTELEEAISKIGNDKTQYEALLEKATEQVNSVDDFKKAKENKQTKEAELNSIQLVINKNREQLADINANEKHRDLINTAKEQVTISEQRLKDNKKERARLEKEISTLNVLPKSTYKVLLNNLKEKEDLLVKTNIQKASLDGELKLIVEQAKQAVQDYKRCKEASENYERLHNQITIMNLTNQSLIKFKEQRIKNSIPELTDIASEILARFTDNKFTQLILTDKFETFVVTENNVKRPVSQLSGGELSAAAIALRLAIALFLNNGQQHLLILDEVLTAMSSDRSQLILETITSLTNAQIILIAHNDGINSFADKVVHL